MAIGFLQLMGVANFIDVSEIDAISIPSVVGNGLEYYVYVGFGRTEPLGEERG
jgi:hypothetical protein